MQSCYITHWSVIWSLSTYVHPLPGYQQLNIFHHQLIPIGILLVNVHLFFVYWRTFLDNVVWSLHFERIFTSFNPRGLRFYVDHTEFFSYILGGGDINLRNLVLFLSTSFTSFENVRHAFNIETMWFTRECLQYWPFYHICNPSQNP